MLTIIGGIYYELCRIPANEVLVGSGMRAALALCETVSGIKLVGCIGKAEKVGVESECELHRIRTELTEIETTIRFEYFHPLSRPFFYPHQDEPDKVLPKVSANAVLYYGTIESTVEVEAEYLIYDPQNGEMIATEQFTAQHLALVLNFKEAILLSGLGEDTNHKVLGEKIQELYHAETVVIKNGAKGAYVFHQGKMNHVPVFETESVWPIGSGDIFSAVFAREWALQRKLPSEAALIASQSVAHYCETKELPLPAVLPLRNPRDTIVASKKVYLAGPFFSTAQLWLIEELRSLLFEFGHQVFSPLHDVGNDHSPEFIVDSDLTGLKNCDIMLAVVTNLDPGTLFEIGYARSHNLPVVVLAELEKEDDLLMLMGSGCIITRTITDAIYKTAW